MEIALYELWQRIFDAAHLYLEARVEDETLKKVVWHSVATALASMVFPVPGGPNMSTPCTVSTFISPSFEMLHAWSILFTLCILPSRLMLNGGCFLKESNFSRNKGQCYRNSGEPLLILKLEDQAK